MEKLMNMNKNQCPACGATEMTRYENKKFDQLTLGNKFFYDEIYYKCNSCFEEGDFLSETDQNYVSAQKNAQLDMIKEILDGFNRSNISMAMLERIFELPARTLTRWKNGDFSSSGLALLRVLTTFPWIISVAEHKFNSTFASSAIIKAAVQEFEQGASKALNPPVAVTALERKSGGLITKFDRAESRNTGVNEPQVKYYVGR
jgi:hypothetical protein